MRFYIWKRVNKILIGAILWTAILWLWGLSMSPKWKWFWKKFFDWIKSITSFFSLWLKELFKNVKSKK